MPLPLLWNVLAFTRPTNCVRLKCHWSSHDVIREQGQPVPGNKSKPEQWSHDTKFAVVVETATLSESELGEYCREKGLYPEQVNQWKQQCLQGFQSDKEQTKTIKQQARNDKAEIKALKKDLRFKEKALAETAALLVLRKKLRAFYGEEPEED